MKTLTKSILIVLFVLTLSFSLCALSFADIPHLINYQGKLADNTGKPVTDGAYSVTFRIYDAESAGTLLWEETQSVSISRGIFSVLLGGVTALNLAFDKPYWLEIKVGTEVMSPRQRMASVGYAIRAENADQAQNANQAQNATTIGTVGVSTTPAANKLLPLDSNAKLPSTVLPLKVYDSGWFAVGTNGSYTKTHSLGTAKLLITIYASTDSGGASSWVNQFSIGGEGEGKGSYVSNITTTQLTLRTGSCWSIHFFDVNGNQNGYPTGYCRIVAVALE